jgi:hypothetical protein
VLCDVAGELSNLDLLAQLALEAGEEDLALPGLQSVHDGWDGPLHIDKMRSISWA